MLVITLYLVTNFPSKGILVIHQGKSLFFKIFPATKAVIIIIFKISLLSSLVILAVRVKILNSRKDLYLVVFVDSRVASEDISKL